MRCQISTLVECGAFTARRARAGPKDSSTNPQDPLPLVRGASGGSGRGDGPGPRDHPPTVLTGPRTRSGDPVGGRRRKPARDDWRSQHQGAIAAHVCTTNRSPKQIASSGRTWCQLSGDARHFRIPRATPNTTASSPRGRWGSAPGCAPPDAPCCSDSRSRWSCRSPGGWARRTRKTAPRAPRPPASCA